MAGMTECDCVNGKGDVVTECDSVYWEMSEVTLACAQTMVIISHWVGLTLPGIMLEPVGVWEV
jgi:hypothetical protein